jgi:hypothetical protein
MTAITELERSLQATSDRALLAVYADALQAAGDPRGEPIAIDRHIVARDRTCELEAKRRARLYAEIYRARAHDPRERCAPRRGAARPHPSGAACLELREPEGVAQILAVETLCMWPALDADVRAELVDVVDERPQLRNELSNGYDEPTRSRAVSPSAHPRAPAYSSARWRCRTCASRR